MFLCSCFGSSFPVYLFPVSSLSHCLFLQILSVSVCLPTQISSCPSPPPSLQTFPTPPSPTASMLPALCLPLWSLLSINPQRSVCLLQIRHNASDRQCNASSAAAATTKTAAAGCVGGVGGGEEMGSKNINKKTLRLGGEAYKSTLQVNQLRILSDRLMKYTASNWTLVNKRRGGGEMGRMGDGG